MGVRVGAAEVLDVDGTQGLPPEQLPPLTWTGEKLQSDWTERLLAGTLSYRSRPWLKARMPAFAAWAPSIARGLAAEHGVSSGDGRPADDPAMIEAGRLLSLRGRGLDCRQCHSLTNVTEKQENNAQGISFLHTAAQIAVRVFPAVDGRSLADRSALQDVAVFGRPPAHRRDQHFGRRCPASV